MAEHTHSIRFNEVPCCTDCNMTVKCTFACPVCGHSSASTSINQDPYRHFMIEKNAGFLCRTCAAYFDFVGYDEGNKRYLFLRDRGKKIVRPKRRFVRTLYCKNITNEGVKRLAEERTFDGPGADEKLKTFAQGNKPVTRMADISDAILRINKITMAITDCTNKNYVRFNLDPDEALILAHDVLFDRVKKMDTVFQGSGQGDDVQSRRLDLSYDPGDPDDPKKHKGYHLVITNGPGTRMATGGVLPNKSRSAEDVRVNIFIRRDEFRQAMALVKARIEACETSHVAKRLSVQDLLSETSGPKGER